MTGAVSKGSAVFAHNSVRLIRVKRCQDKVSYSKGSALWISAAPNVSNGKAAA
jgi:hypothetical protein